MIIFIIPPVDGTMADNKIIMEDKGYRSDFRSALVNFTGHYPIKYRTNEFLCQRNEIHH